MKRIVVKIAELKIYIETGYPVVNDVLQDFRVKIITGV